mgnify:CR=1 FL=1
MSTDVNSVEFLQGKVERLQLRLTQLEAHVCGGVFVIGNEYEFSDCGKEWHKAKLDNIDCSFIYDTDCKYSEGYSYIRRVKL